MADIILINLNSNDLKYFRSCGWMLHRRFFLAPVLPHLGLAHLSSVLKIKGFSVKVIDANLFSLKEDEVINLLIENEPKCIAITVNSPILPVVYSFINKFKEAQRINNTVIKDTKIIVGGPYITFRPEGVFDLGADFGCLGESEISLLILCEYIINHRGDLSDIKGLVYLEDGRKKIGQIQIVEDLDFLPFPSYDSYLLPNKMNCQKVDFFLMPMQTSRGCIYNCSFCPTSNFLNKGIRFKSINKVMEEIDNLQKKFNFHILVFIDELFTFNKDRIICLSRLLKQKKSKFRWICETRVDFVDKELITQMKLGGCQRISFGVESGTQEIRSSLGKSFSNQDCLKAFKTCREVGVDTTAFLMVGLPSESKKQIKNTLSIPYRLKANYIRIQLLIIFPGTKIYKQCIRSGRLKSNIWSRYMRGEIDLPCYIPQDLKLKELLSLIMKAYLRFYLNPCRLIRELNKRTCSFWLHQWWNFRVKYKYSRFFMVYQESIKHFPNPKG